MIMVIVGGHVVVSTPVVRGAIERLCPECPLAHQRRRQGAASVPKWHDFSGLYPDALKALAGLPNDSVVDGKVVALDAARRPVNTLQNYGSSPSPIFYFAFDLLMLDGRNVINEPLGRRRELLQQSVLPKIGDQVGMG